MRPEYQRARQARRARLRRQRLAALGAVAAIVVGGGIGYAMRPQGDATTPSSAAASTAPRTTPATTAPARPVEHRPAFAVLTTPAVPVRSSVRVPVLMFHRVASEATVTNAVSADLTITPARFRAEMDWLAAHGYQPISETQLWRALYQGGPLPPKPVVLTFDDGYVDDAVAVAPILRPRHWPATLAIIAGRAGAAAFLSWKQIVQLDRQGMDIASHSMDHVELAGAGADVLQRQLVDSRRLLAQHLGHPVYWFVYPAGSYDAAAEDAARRAGYLLAYTTDPGSTVSAGSPMATPRVRIHGADTVADFAAAVTSASGG